MAQLEFGDYLRKARVQAKKRLKDVADELKCSVVYISDLELGRRGVPSPEKIRSIAKALGIGPGELLKAAGVTKQRVEIDLDETIPGRNDFALALARSLDELNEQDMNELRQQIDEMLRRRKNK